MNDLQRSQYLNKAIFHFFNPRREFSKRNGHHARTRFLERYGVTLSESDYEMINLKIILGDYKLIASEFNSSAFYNGFFKGVEFFAIFNPNEGMVVTFLEEDMTPSFLFRESAKLFYFENDKYQDTPSYKSLSEQFLDEGMNNSVLEYFDSFLNLSIYSSEDSRFILFDHNTSSIKAMSSEIERVMGYIDSNYCTSI